MLQNKIEYNNYKEYNNNRYSPKFEALWKEYPRKVDKGAAYKAYQARLKEGYTDEQLLKATKAYASYCRTGDP